jgi:large subunit ribosomal protein L25
MEEFLLKAERRSVIGKQVKALRRAGELPAILYGSHVDPTPISLNLREATRILSHMASSSLVTLDVDGEKHLALVREKQRDFIRGTYKHVDFQVVSMKEKLRVAVPLEITGESPAVKDFNGILVNGLTELEVEAFPQDLPAKIVVDISGLKTVGSGLYVRDILPPENVKVLDEPGDMIILVTAQAAEEVEVVAEVAEEIEPEVIEKGKKEEEGEEGEKAEKGERGEKGEKA